LKFQLLNPKGFTVNIFIIGTGNVGAAQAKSAVAAGNQVFLYSAAPEELETVASSTGATAVSSLKEGVDAAELIYLAIPAGAVADIAAEIKPYLGSKVLVDGTNPLNATFSDLEYKGESAAADLQAALPEAKVVKAFNTVFAGRYSSPSQNGKKLQVYIAGNDDAAKSVVGNYANSLGFDSVDLGGLRLAKSMEELAFLNISLNATKSLSWQSAWSLTGPDGLK
jgi:predicted dinucleotide-binding enzyme